MCSASAVVGPALICQPILPAASCAAGSAPDARAKRRPAGGAGLGYYRRAGYLLDGARHVVERCGGALPTTTKELQRIPGAGLARPRAAARLRPLPSDSARQQWRRHRLTHFACSELSVWHLDEPCGALAAAEALLDARARLTVLGAGAQASARTPERRSRASPSASLLPPWCGPLVCCAAASRASWPHRSSAPPHCRVLTGQPLLCPKPCLHLRPARRQCASGRHNHATWWSSARQPARAKTDLPVAAQDANVVRVLARLRAVGGDPASREAVQRWAALAGAALDPARPGDFNQVPPLPRASQRVQPLRHALTLSGRRCRACAGAARMRLPRESALPYYIPCTMQRRAGAQALMELGALVCTGGAAPPRCSACPLRACCRAHRQHSATGGAARPVTDYPAKVAGRPRRSGCVTCWPENGLRV